MTLAKDLLNDLVETVEDVATAVLGFVLAVFVLGAWYGSIFSGKQALWYPLYLFVLVLVLKLLKDLLTRGGKKKEK